MNRKYTIFSLSLLAVAFVTPLHAELIEEEPNYQDNTGALTTTNAAADIVSNADSNVAGTHEGEITLHSVDAGMEVFSSLNKVELIPHGSDGWVGRLSFGNAAVTFHPNDRPMLNCPAQALNGWYGPCKVAQGES